MKSLGLNRVGEVRHDRLRDACTRCNTCYQRSISLMNPSAWLDRTFKDLCRLGWTDDKILAHGFTCFDALYAQLKSA